MPDLKISQMVDLPNVTNDTIFPAILVGPPNYQVTRVAILTAGPGEGIELVGFGSAIISIDAAGTIDIGGPGPVTIGDGGGSSLDMDGAGGLTLAGVGNVGMQVNSGENIILLRAGQPTQISVDPTTGPFGPLVFAGGESDLLVAVGRMAQAVVGLLGGVIP